MFSKKRADFFVFPGQRNLSFTLRPARLAQLLDISAEMGSL